MDWRFRFIKSIKMVENPKELRAVLNPLSLRILEMLWEHEDYPLELARKLGVDEQKIYYHVRFLHRAGLIELVGKREIKGAVAKYYRTAASAAGFELPFGEEICAVPMGTDGTKANADRVRMVFGQFASPSGMFKGLIVVGSPDPHGPFKAHARDGHYALYLAMALGRYFELPRTNFIKLDTELRAENRMKEDLVLIGGPGVNLITAEFNEHLPIYLTGEAHGKAPKAVFGFELYSELSRRRYKEPTIGYIVKCPNPLDPSRTVIVLAGLGRRGTLAAILALTRNADTIIQRSEVGRFGHVVRGIDTRGTGEVDDIELLE